MLSQALQANIFMEISKKFIAEKLQAIPENQLTKTILVPLFETLGYERVQFTGGPSEEGKDLICWSYDKMNEVELTVAQVKHYKPSNKASDKNSFETIVNQLTNSLVKRVAYTDKTMHLPTKVLLITTYEVDSKLIEKRFDSNVNLRDNKIKIIDGIKLAELLLNNKIDIVRNLLGYNVNIATEISNHLNNRILLDALGFDEKKDLSTIYTDIDFSLGKSTTKVLFNSDFNSSVLDFEIDSKNWAIFKSDVFKIKEIFTTGFISEDFNSIENSYKEVSLLYNDWKGKLSIAKRELGEAHKSQSSEQKITKIKDAVKDLEKNEPNPKYKFTLNGKLIEKEINKYRKWIENEVSIFNNNKPSIKELKKFIETCTKIINAASILFNNKIILAALNPNDEIIIRQNFETTRLKLPIELIFDTQVNISLLGDAGAGKSTSLQMYTYKNLINDNKRLYIFIPLSRLIQTWNDKIRDIQEERGINNLEEGIAIYFTSLNAPISQTELILELTSKGGVILLDGIDEAIKLAPWLIKSINSFSTKYPNVQIIVSSRMSVKYLEDIPFFAVTLLPFDDNQRDSFIAKWFKDNDEKRINKIFQHLKKNEKIREIIKTPLLTTILCVLAEHDISLPDTEVKLYEERHRLLTGHYDIAKSIRRTNSNMNLLDNLCRKLAFHFHKNNQREYDLDDIFAIATDKLKTMTVDRKIINAVNELIDPCNILVPMTPDGKYGFDHLRFQEYLAAKELLQSREIDLKVFLNQGWWRGVMILFAQMHDKNIYYVVEDVIINGRLETCIDTIMAMSKTRSVDEQKNISKMLSKFKTTNIVNYDNNEVDEYDDL